MIRKAHLIQFEDVSLVNRELEKWLVENEGNIHDVDYSFKIDRLEGRAYPDGSKEPDRSVTTLLIEYYDV